ncbi:hypothetical protein MUK42_25336 [Musa troglodytarum]|uniref:Uncharacterized protein n=1 Tax=Musa troglodytarum TaxID=320322 RepID=A0A9E7E9J4_9LILI|nr:hypothetical protein MUK42_25336 [Musa troglodytarum]
MAPKKKGRGHSSKSKKVAGSSSTAVPSPPPDDPAVITDSAGEAATPRRSSTAPTGHSPPTQETPLSPPASQEPPSPAIPPPSPSSRLRTLPAEAEPTTAGEVSTSHPSLRPDPSNSITPTTSPSSSEEECSFAIPPPLPSSRLLAPVDDASLRSSGETSTSVPYLPRFAPSTRQRPTRGTSSSRRTSRRPSSPAANLPRPPPPLPSHPPFPSHRPLPSLPPLPLPPCTALPRVTDQERDIFTLICCTAEDVFAARYHLKTTNVQEADSSSSPQTGPAHVPNSTPSMTEAMNMIGELADERDETEVVNASVAAYVDLDTILHSFNATPMLITRMIEQARAGGSLRNPGGRGGSSSVSGAGPGGASSGAGPGGASIA